MRERGSRVTRAAKAAMLSLTLLAPWSHAQVLPAPPASATVATASVAKNESMGLGSPGRGFVAAPNKPGVPRPEGAATRDWFGRTLLPLLGVLALAVGVGAALRTVARRQGTLRATLGAGGRAPAGILEVLGRYPVGRGVTLILLKLDSRILLLSQSAGGLREQQDA